MSPRSKQHLTLVPDRRHAALCQDLLSHALESASVAELVIRDLGPEDFSADVRPIFEGLRDTFPLAGKVDPTAIAARATWAALAELVGRSRNVPAEGVFSALREIRRVKVEIEAARLIRAGAYGPAAAMLARAGEASAPSPESPGRITGAVIERFLTDAARNRERGVLGPKTGIYPLDRITLGMSPGSVWAIAGGTSSGKSTLLSQILVEGLLQRAVVAVFSLEMPIPWQLARLTGAYLRKSPTRVFMGDLDESEQLQCQGTLEVFGETPLYIFREIAELSEICAAARRIRAEHGRLDLVAVDFIQNVAVRGAGAQMERMAAASVELQRLSGEVNCCCLIASQLSNEAVREKGGGILTFRYASELGHAADVAMELVSKTDGTVDLLVRKNRSGRLGKIPLRWGNEYSRFEVAT